MQHFAMRFDCFLQCSFMAARTATTIRLEQHHPQTPILVESSQYFCRPMVSGEISMLISTRTINSLVTVGLRPEGQPMAIILESSNESS